jgi:hypothetical protein
MRDTSPYRPRMCSWSWRLDLGMGWCRATDFEREGMKESLNVDIIIIPVLIHPPHNCGILYMRKKLPC